VPPTILLATRSEGKLRELRPLFTDAGYDVIDLADARIAEGDDEELLERHGSFEENARAKARHFHRLSGGIPTVADDSGLEVAALGGAPGVRSKRWSDRQDRSDQPLDDANNALLLDRLRGAADRSARYVCVACYVDAEREIIRRGETRGRILESPRGSGGFGYDPLFLSDDLQETFGESTREAKERVSHRGRAMRALVEALRAG
jgi:XTP/dITP diphosphohydrolase